MCFTSDLGFHKRQYKRHGFTIIPGLLSKPQVRELRARLEEVFQSDLAYPGDNPRVRACVCARHPELRWVLSYAPLVKVLRGLLGDDFGYLPEMPAYRDLYAGWHTDTESQERAGIFTHWEHGYRLAQAALYLQDNGPQGGGVDFVLGSHTRSDPSPPAWRCGMRSALLGDRLERRRTSFSGLLNWAVAKVRTLLIRAGQPRPYCVPTRAGDLLVYHPRILHRGTPPRNAPQSKLVLFFAVSANDKHGLLYKRFMAYREDYVFMDGFRWPQQLLELGIRHRLRFV